MAALFEVKRREKEGVVILDLRGRLTVGEAAGMLRSSFASLNKEKVLQVVANLELVDYIDSTGLGTLVMGFTAMQREGGVLKLMRLNRRNVELLVLTKLTTVFEVFGEEQDAVNSFFPERAIKKFDILNFIRETEEN